MKERLLDILIPTYNRKSFLEKNIGLLVDYIERLNMQDRIRIIVSNNASTDGTKEMLEEKQKILRNTVQIEIYHHSKNIGLERNAVFCLSKAKARYCMFLGDDDYIEFEYLKEVINLLERYGAKITCIIPSFVCIDAKGDLLKDCGRDYKLKSRLYRGGNLDAARLMIKGHQLSGLVFLREGTLEAYLQREEYRNIYLFMFFTAFNVKRGYCYHLTKYPVKVTQVPQNKKDWNYGNDGLYDERFKNAKALFGDCLLFRLIAEFYIIKSDSISIHYLKKGIKIFFRYLMNFQKLEYATPLIKAVYPLFLLWNIPFRLVNSLKRKIYKRLYLKIWGIS